MLTNPEATILLVEDDSAVRSVIARTLDRAGYRVHECPNGETAVDFVSGHTGPIDLLLIDTVLGGISGIEAAARIRELRPRLPVLHMSGYARERLFGDDERSSEQAFISKPFQRQDLDQRIRALIAARQSANAAP